MQFCSSCSEIRLPTRSHSQKTCLERFPTIQIQTTDCKGSWRSSVSLLYASSIFSRDKWEYMSTMLLPCTKLLYWFLLWLQGLSAWAAGEGSTYRKATLTEPKIWSTHSGARKEPHTITQVLCYTFCTATKAGRMQITCANPQPYNPQWIAGILTPK